MKEERPIFTDYLTLPGRLLFIFCVLLFAAGFYKGFCDVADSGVAFPLFVVVVPPVVVSIFVFFGGAWLLDRCGIQIYTKKRANGETQNEAEEIQSAEQDGTEQPATRSESDSEGGDKPQPASEGRSR